MVFDVEIYDGIHGRPILIGGGSFKDVQKASEEARAIDATAELEPDTIMSPGTKHFYSFLGAIAGVETVTTASLASYEAMVRASYNELAADILDKHSI